MARKWSRPWWMLQVSAAIFACAALAWFGSLFCERWRIEVVPLTLTVDVRRGRVEIVYANNRDGYWWLLGDLQDRRARPNFRWNMLPCFGWDSRGLGMAIPFWIPTLAFGAVTGTLWLVHGPLREHWECTACGYDLRGGRGG